jgi:NADH-quinone oxidoreductase subunit N
VAFLAIGFGFKVAAVPFHMWTPDVYEGAPSPVTAFMSGAVKAAAFAAFLRVFLTAFEALHDTWGPILWGLAAITMVTANLVALVQTSMKRMLAYSSIAHAGYLLVAITAANETAAAGLLFYLLVYTVMNIGAFAVVIAVGRQGEENPLIEDYAGLGQRQPMLGVLLTLFLLSLAGFPGTGGFIGKIYLLRGALDAGLWGLAVLLVLTTVVSYYYYLRVAWFAWMREPARPEQHDHVPMPLPIRIALVGAAAVVLYLGIFPASALELARASVEGMMAAGGALGIGE